MTKLLTEALTLLDGFQSAEDVIHQYNAPEDALDDAVMIAGTYTYEDYSGSSTVFWLTKDGKFFEQTGGHCSCHGLEDQWGPAEVSLDYIRQRAKGLEGRDANLLKYVQQLWGLGEVEPV